MVKAQCSLINSLFASKWKRGRTCDEKREKEELAKCHSDSFEILSWSCVLCPIRNIPRWIPPRFLRCLASVGFLRDFFRKLLKNHEKMSGRRNATEILGRFSGDFKCIPKGFSRDSWWFETTLIISRERFTNRYWDSPNDSWKILDDS